MDWAKAIERNREALAVVVAGLFAMLGFDGAAAGRVPQGLRSAVLRVLRPAESAMRRLIVVAARGLVAVLGPARAMPAGAMPAGAIIGTGGARAPAFQLVDPRRHFALPGKVTFTRHPPRVFFFGGDPRVAALPMWSAPAPAPVAKPAPPPDDGQRLWRRLQALKLALNDLPRQARRLARWRARRQKLPGATFTSPLRPGTAPGHRRTAVHDVDTILHDCQWLAFDALRPDTS